MKKILLHASFSLSLLIILTGSTNPQWVQTNWPASSGFFSLYTYQDTLFARSWDSLSGGNVFLTADNGENWTQISSADSNIDILSIIMWEDTILAGTWDGIYLSTDDGSTWEAIMTSGIPENTPIWSLVMFDTLLFAGTQGNIYSSSDYGFSWSAIGSGIPSNARITSLIEDGDKIFAGSSADGIFMSNDEGTSWTSCNSGLTDMHISQLMVVGIKLFAVTLNGVFLSENHGTDWTADDSNLNHINCFVVVNDHLFAGTDDKGVYLSVDHGITWFSFNDGLPAETRIWSMIATSNNIYAGTSRGVWRLPIDTYLDYQIYLPIINN